MRASLLPSRVMSLIHKLFQLYGWGGPLQPCVVRRVPQMHWLPRNTAETDGTKHGEGWCIQPYYYLWVTYPCDLRPFIHFSPNSRWSLAGRSSSSIWNTACCIWKGQVETDALSCFSRMALLTHNFRHTALLMHNFRHTALPTHNFRHTALPTHNLSCMAMLMHNFNHMALLTHNFSHTAMLTHNVSCMAVLMHNFNHMALLTHNFSHTAMLTHNVSCMAVLMHNFSCMALLTHNFSHTAMLTHNVSCMAVLMHNFNHMALLTHNFSHTAMLTHNVSCMAVLMHNFSCTALLTQLCWCPILAAWLCWHPVCRSGLDGPQSCSHNSSCISAFSVIRLRTETSDCLTIAALRQYMECPSVAGLGVNIKTSYNRWAGHTGRPWPCWTEMNSGTPLYSWINTVTGMP